MVFEFDDRGVLVRFGKADWQQVHRRCMVAIARTLQHVEIEGES